MNRKWLGLLIIIGIIVLAGEWLYLTRIADFPAAQARLVVRSGTTTITRTGGKPEHIEQGKVALVNAGDSIQTDGASTLSAAGVQIEIEPGAELQIARYGAVGNEAQVELALKSGQMQPRVVGYADRRSFFRLRTAAGTLDLRAGEAALSVDGDKKTEIGLVVGIAYVSAQGRTVNLAIDQGTTIIPGQPPADAAPWSRIAASVFRPDGSPVNVPIMLANAKTGSQYHFESQQTTIVPQGTYNLSIDLLEPYKVGDLALPSGGLNEIPITLSEIVFTITSVDGTPVGYNALKVQGSASVTAVHDAPVLISPGKWTVVAAREEKPDKIQSVQVDLLPGQRATTTLRDNLFGGGAVQVHVIQADGSPAQPVSVVVYTAGNEVGSPLLTFKSDGAPQPLAEGNYAISVQTKIAQRFEVTVSQQQSAPLMVPLGSIVVNFVDGQGNPIQHNSIVYIASATEMQRLKLPIDQMRRTPYGLAITAGTIVTIPAGTYNVVIDDPKAPAQQEVTVPHGPTVTLNLPAVP